MNVVDNILLVVDYQKDFVDGSLGFEKAKLIDKDIASKIEKCIENNGLVIVTMDTHGEDYLHTQEGTRLPIRHCIKHTDGWELYGKSGELCKKYLNNPNLIILEKSTFGSLELGNTLTKLCESCDISINCTIEIIGVVTNICVISNAVICKSALPEAKIVTNSMLCASNDPEIEQKAFDIMDNLQMEVI